MFDPKQLLDELLGSKIPGTESTVRDKASEVTQLAKDNPLATGALAAVLLGTGAGRAVTGSAIKLGGLAAIAGLAYKAYQNYQTGDKPDGSRRPRAGTAAGAGGHQLPSFPGASGRAGIRVDAGARHDRGCQGGWPHR